jgi:hypothetical protein
LNAKERAFARLFLFWKTAVLLEVSESWLPSGDSVGANRLATMRRLDLLREAQANRKPSILLGQSKILDILGRRIAVS